MEEKKESRRLHLSISTLCLIIVAFLLMVVLFFSFTWYDQKKTDKKVDDTLESMQERLERFQSNLEDDKAIELYGMLDKARELNDRLIYEKSRMKELIKNYQEEQRLSGIIVTGGDLRPVIQTETEGYERWTKILHSEAVKNIRENPRKYYMSQVSVNDMMYDIVAIARKDARGILFFYRKNEQMTRHVTQRAMRFLFEDEAQNTNGTIVLADNDGILSTNESRIKGLRRDQIKKLINKKIKIKENGLTCFYTIYGRYYGNHKKIDGYDFYALYSERETYETRRLVMSILVVSYVIFLMMLSMIRAHFIRMHMQKMSENQEKLMQIAKEAKRANIAKSDFLRRMSHDVRTPLNGIQGMIPICRHYRGDQEKLEECYDKIMVSSQFLLELVSDVLNMSKIESEEIRLIHTPFVLCDVVKETMDVMAVQAQESGLNFELEQGTIRHSYLLGSSLHLKRILQNVVCNAIKYNRENGSIKLSYYEKECDLENKTEFVFVCADTGKGMSEEFQKRAFEPFEQEDNTARTNYVGSGLGLPIVKKIVEQMNGTIFFESKKGVGTTFTITLPFEIDETGETKSTLVKQSFSLEGLCLLLVEDNDLNREIASFVLEDAGALVKEARNGAEAVSRFLESEEGEYDAVLMDIMMPVMDGLTAAKMIRASGRSDAGTIPIIAMSANAFTDDIEKSHAAGMNAHLVKPLDMEKLKETIGLFCERQEIGA